MNIQMQICGMIILIVLVVFYKSNKTLKLFSEGLFFRVMIIAMVSLCLDILSLIVIEYRHDLPVFLVNLVCKTYIISLIWVGMAGTIYVLTDILSESVLSRVIKKMIILTDIQGIIVYALPIYIHEQAEEVYTYGPAVLCVYAFALVYVFATIIILFVFHKRVSRRREFAVGLWMMIWIIAAVIQFFNNEILLVGFATSIGVLILLVIMENPESNLDRRLGCFNSYALSEYVKELIRKNKKYSVLSLSFGNTVFLEENRQYTEEMFRGLLRLTGTEKNIMSFKNTSSDMIFLSEDALSLERMGQRILDYFTRNEEWHREARLFFVESGHDLVTQEEFFGFLIYLQIEFGSEKEQVLRIPEGTVEKYREQYVIEQKIAEALNEDRVEVFLQPIFDNEANAFNAAEALVRIREKDGSLLSPGIFIPVAEGSGQILELGERVFEKVCDFLKQSEAVDLGLRFVEVNLSVIQCEQKNLAERMINIIDKYAVSPSLINMEITETASISARNILLKNMKKLIEYGFRFALDDFGKGESNLMYVVEMPVSIVKLDIDITKAFMRSAKAQHVVRAVVGMAHDLGLKLVAEGIETKEELESICKENMDYIQGYYYSKPLTMQEFLSFLRNNKK